MEILRNFSTKCLRRIKKRLKVYLLTFWYPKFFKYDQTSVQNSPNILSEIDFSETFRVWLAYYYTSTFTGQVQLATVKIRQSKDSASSGI